VCEKERQDVRLEHWVGKKGKRIVHENAEEHKTSDTSVEMVAFGEDDRECFKEKIDTDA
jgi:hypothetical protein